MIASSPTSIRTTERTAVSLARSIAWAGAVIGVLAGADMVIFYYLTQNTSPVLSFQYIASGLLGLSAFAGGYTTALLGVLIHFVVSFVVAAVFILAARWIALLRRTVFVSALVYGAAVNLVMGAVVTPISAAPKLPISTVVVVHGLIADAMFVGLPLAIIVWRNARVKNAIATA